MALKEKQKVKKIKDFFQALSVMAKFFIIHIFAVFGIIVAFGEAATTTRHRFTKGYWLATAGGGLEKVVIGAFQL